MIPERNWRHFFAEREAQSLCDQLDIDDYPRILAYVLHRNFLEAIDPYIRMKTRVMNLCASPGVMLVKPDGSLEMLPRELPKAVLDFMEQIDELITREAERWKVPAVRP